LKRGQRNFSGALLSGHSMIALNPIWPIGPRRATDGHADVGWRAHIAEVKILLRECGTNASVELRQPLPDVMPLWQPRLTALPQPGSLTISRAAANLSLSVSSRLGGADATSAGAFSEGGDDGRFWADPVIAFSRSPKFCASRMLLDLLLDKAGEKQPPPGRPRKRPPQSGTTSCEKGGLFGGFGRLFMGPPDLVLQQPAAWPGAFPVAHRPPGAAVQRSRAIVSRCRVLLHVVRCLTDCAADSPQKPSGDFFQPVEAFA